jgi:hypothetical protein
MRVDVRLVDKKMFAITVQFHSLNVEVQDRYSYLANFYA